MRTLGIDLSSRPVKTAACLIEWDAGGATVSDLSLRLTDEAMLRLAAQLELATTDQGTDAIGIDAPFGWPLPFVEFVSRSPAAGEPLPAFNPKLAKELCYRLTDLRVIQELGLYPLSVAADRIALPAMRCAGLLDSLGVDDRSGVDGVFEVYPAAALKAWGLPYKGYKAKGINSGRAKKNLADLFALVCTSCPWLRFPDTAADLFSTSDDAFDALIASLAARAAALGQTGRPLDSNEHARATVEGWIAVPGSDCRIGDLGLSAVPSGADQCSGRCGSR